MVEKQNLKNIYGIREEQLKRYYAEALADPERTGDTLISLLEARLDNAVFRAGFAPTRPAARQMSSHRLLLVNGRAVSVPSRRLKVGDKITVKESKRGKAVFTNLVKHLQNINLPSWITLEPEAYSFSVIAVPSGEEAGIGVDVQAIVEYFAR